MDCYAVLMRLDALTQLRASELATAFLGCGVWNHPSQRAGADVEMCAEGREGGSSVPATTPVLERKATVSEGRGRGA